MSIRSPLQVFLGLVAALLLFVTPEAGTRRAMAQVRSVCDSMSVTAQSAGECCFRFSMTRLDGRSITRIVLRPYGGTITGATAGNTAGTAGASYTADSSQVRYNFPNGMPRRFDSATICFNSPQGVITLLVTWWAGDALLCTDTLTLRCQTTPPPPRCLQIFSDTARCLQNGTYSYTYRVSNLSSFNIATMTTQVKAPGNNVPLTSRSTQLNPLVQPGQATPAQSLTFTLPQGSNAQTVTVIVQICSPVQIKRDSSGRVDSTRQCCTDSVVIKLPACQPTNNCGTVDSSNITCTANGYQWCFTFRNNAAYPINQLTIVSGVNGGSQTVNFSPAVNPGGVKSLCVPLGAGKTGGVTNSLTFCYNVVRFDTIRRGDSIITVRDTVVRRECCTTQVQVKLPECNSTGCLTMLDPRVECDSSGRGYNICFAIRNNASWKAWRLAMTPISPVDVLIQPGETGLPGVAPNGTATVCFTLQTKNLSGGVLVLRLRMCDSTGRNCCYDSVTIQLPPCGHEPSNDCCANFRKVFSGVVASGSSSGFGAVNGFLQAGPQSIKSVSATLVSATVNGQPAYGYFNFGLLYNAFGVGTVTPPPYGSEVVWTMPGGVNMNGATQFFLSTKFPPLATNLKRDTVRFCVKFRYTDINCVTCDTTLCFTTVRYRFGGNNGNGKKTERKDEGGLLGAAGATVSGSITGANTSSMKVVFPQPPAELGTVNYVGLRIMPGTDGVTITSVNSKEAGRTFTIANGWALSSFKANAGDEANLDITYANLGNRASVEHRVALLYTSSNSQGGILEEEMVVTLTKSGQVTKDTLISTHAGLTEAYTFAVHLSNANDAKEPISRMVITTDDPTKIIAVGPTASDSRATLSFGTLQDGSSRNFVGEIVDGGQVAIAPAKEYGPIYLTLVGQVGETFNPTVHFTTLNANGQVLSEGSVTLTDPAAGVTRGADGQVTTGAMLRQSFPNPATGSATIQFRLSSNERGVSLVVTDMKGAQVATLIDGESLTAGEHAAYFDTSSLPAGTYYYTLRVGGRVETKSMQIIR